jgi:hypothetical protein
MMTRDDVTALFSPYARAVRKDTGEASSDVITPGGEPFPRSTAQKFRKRDRAATQVRP